MIFSKKQVKNKTRQSRISHYAHLIRDCISYENGKIGLYQQILSINVLALNHSTDL